MTADRADREGRCPDRGYCHGSTLAAGSTPCPPGSCLRVRTSGPLSGVYPGDRWPAEVLAAHGVERRTTGDGVEFDPHAPVGARHVEAVVAALRDLPEGLVDEATVYRLAQVASRAERGRLQPSPVATAPDGQQYAVEAGWLVLVTGQHTCAGGTPESGYAHEPSCGLEPLERVEVLAPLLAPEVERFLTRAREERDEAREEYDALRDAVIEQLNPPDSDEGELSIMVRAVEYAAQTLAAAPCSCPPDAGPPTWNGEPCHRCQALGRARDERIDR